MQRSRLRPKSKKRAAQDRDPEHIQIRERVFARDGYTCQAPKSWGVCFGPLSYHHILKSSQGGEYTEENGLTLCVRHNQLLEQDADVAKEAHDLGMVKFSWESTRP